MRLRALTVVASLVATLSVTTLAAGPALAGTGDPVSESTLVSLTNGSRTASGLPALRSVVDLTNVARGWANWMADHGSLQHNPNLAGQVQGWYVLAENVGYSGRDATTLHNAFMNSAGHRANILDGRVSQVGIGAARDGSGTLWVAEVFRQPDGSTAGVQSTSWNLDTPGLAPAGSGALLAAELQADGSTTVRTMSDSGFGGGTPLGGVALNQPTIARSPAGDVSVVVRGADSGLWLREKPAGSGWRGWLPLGGYGTSRAALTSWGAGRLDVVVRGRDGQLWQRSQLSPGAWTGWIPLGGAIAAGSDPDVVAPAPGRLTVAVQGLDGQVWSRSWTGSAWTPWTSLAGRSQGGPTLSSPAPGTVVVSVKGLDGAGWTTTLADGRNLGWGRLGGVLASSPSSTGTAGRVDVLTIGPDGNYYRTTQVAGQWSGWRQVS